MHVAAIHPNHAAGHGEGRKIEKHRWGLPQPKKLRTMGHWRSCAGAFG